MKSKAISNALEFAGKAEKIYRDFHGIDFRQVYYGFSDEYEAGSILAKEVLDRCQKDYKKCGDLICFTLQGDKFPFGHKKFMSKPTILVNENSYNIRSNLVHELSHVGFSELWYFDETIGERLDWLQNDEGYRDMKINYTLHEGLAGKMSTLPEFSQHYSEKEMQHIKDLFLLFSNKNSKSRNTWEHNLGEKPGRINFEDGLSHYFVGSHFIQNIWRDGDTLASMVNMFKENTPSEEEILNPEMYLERIR